MNKKKYKGKNPMIRFEPGPEACNGYIQISWTPSKIDSKQQLIHACILRIKSDIFFAFFKSFFRSRENWGLNFRTVHRISEKHKLAIQLNSLLFLFKVHRN
jgi:hypothetical protein